MACSRSKAHHSFPRCGCMESVERSVVYHNSAEQSMQWNAMNGMASRCQQERFGLLKMFIQTQREAQQSVPPSIGVSLLSLLSLLILIRPLLLLHRGRRVSLLPLSHLHPHPHAHSRRRRRSTTTTTTTAIPHTAPSRILNRRAILALVGARRSGRIGCTAMAAARGRRRRTTPTTPTAAAVAQAKPWWRGSATGSRRSRV